MQLISVFEGRKSRVNGWSDKNQVQLQRGMPHHQLQVSAPAKLNENLVSNSQIISAYLPNKQISVVSLGRKSLSGRLCSTAVISATSAFVISGAVSGLPQVNTERILNSDPPKAKTSSFLRSYCTSNVANS